jgi:hypothetical protein
MPEHTAGERADAVREQPRGGGVDAEDIGEE